MCVKQSRGIRFHRIRDFQWYYFNCLPLTSRNRKPVALFRVAAGRLRKTTQLVPHVVVVAGVVVTEAPSRTDVLTSVGLSATDFGPVLLRPLQLWPPLSCTQAARGRSLLDLAVSVHLDNKCLLLDWRSVSNSWFDCVLLYRFFACSNPHVDWCSNPLSWGPPWFPWNSCL